MTTHLQPFDSPRVQCKSQHTRCGTAEDSQLELADSVVRF